MGQAWCKEKSSKAQDSKSPLDRVFVRCAHRIYPSLKEEGSVLGGATQRVTSSEIGYAGSPPREVLTRGRSIDSVDRPFHPSDWVDVNLEVPSTPRASSVLTNLTVDTSLYPATTPTSSCSNLKDVTPVPPPRRRKRNKGRPLPPKPDEIPENSTGNTKREAGEEPLYSSVKSPKTSGDEQESEDDKPEKPCREDSKQDGRRIKEVYEHKVNGTGRIISSDVVSGKRSSTADERRGGVSRNSEVSHHNRTRSQENEEYEKFARNQLAKVSSTPNRQDGRNPKDQINDTSQEQQSERGARTKNYSTVSLPNYDELDASRHPTKRTKDPGPGEKTKARRPVRSSTGSLPAESFLSPFSEKTSTRLEDYIPRRGSHENLTPYQVLEKLDRGENTVVAGGFVKYDSSKLEDWEIAGIGNCELNHRQPGLEASDEEKHSNGEDVVDFLSSEADREKRFPADLEISGGNAAGSLEKPEAFGKSPTSVMHEADSQITRNGSCPRYFDPPTLAETCTSACSSPASREPFYLDEAKHRSALDTIGGSCRSGTADPMDRSEDSGLIFRRSLSNESEPSEDAYESKELRVHRPPSSTGLIRTISEESLPKEMMEDQQQLDDFFDEKLVKDVHNKMKKDRVDSATPPPSPEPRIKPEILDNDHSTLLKVLKEEAAEGSNLSSMTPSLTELEAALSDMLEKEDTQEEVGKDKLKDKIEGRMTLQTLIEPEIVPVKLKENVEGNTTVKIEGGDRTLVDEDLEGMDEVPVSLGQILEGRKSPKGRKVSFCAWEESGMMEVELDDREFVGRFEPKTVAEENDVSEIPSFFEQGNIVVDLPPEKPSRLHRSADESMLEIPTPPRRRNKGSFGAVQKDEGVQNGSAIDHVYANDRLI